MELLQLYYFKVLAKSGNMTKAAEQCMVSQPTLSISLKRLEDELGYSLFDRRGRRLILNQSGRIFLSYAERILDLVSESYAAGDAGAAAGTISIGFQNHNDFMFELTKSFCRENPGIKLHMYNSLIHELFDVEDFDFIVCNAGHSFPCPMNFRICGKRNWLAVVPEESELALRSSISISDLKDKDFCFLQDNSGNFEDSYLICIESGFVPKTVFTTNSPFSKFLFLSDSSLYAFIPASWETTYSRLEGHRLVPVSDAPDAEEVRIFWKKEKTLSFAAQKYLDFVEDSLQDKAAWDVRHMAPQDQ